MGLRVRLYCAGSGHQTRMDNDGSWTSSRNRARARAKAKAFIKKSIYTLGLALALFLDEVRLRS